MNLFWRRTPFTWIASTSPFQHENRYVIEEGGTPPNDVHELTVKLLEAGGESVCIKFPEPDLEAIIKNGQLFPFKNLALELGEESNCHSNCSRIWWKNKRLYDICTGYGLTEDDQMWRQHTWLMDKRGDEIIETTVERQMYFGITLMGVKAWIFALMNR